MITFDTNRLYLGKIVNVDKMPYQFKGVNNYKHDVQIEIKPACGCTLVQDKNKILKQGETFIIDGYLTKRKQAVKTTKSITVTVKDGVETLEIIRLIFIMDLIAKNDI